MNLEIKNLTKKFDSFTALNKFNYTFSPGIYGLLGPNGAGKSTLMNIITDNLRKSSGEIYLDGIKTNDMGKQFRKILGYMPQQQSLYPGFTLERYLYYMAALKGIRKKDAEKEIAKVLSLVNLTEHASKRLNGFSGGMKQRALIAQAILGDPKIVILDEPTAGLDPKERIRIRNLISEIAFEKIIIIATHVVSDIEYIAKEVLLLKNGEIIASGKPYKLCNEISGKVFIITTTENKLSEISAKFKIAAVSKDENNVYVRALTSSLPDGYDFRSCKPNLEDLYLYFFD